MKWCCGLIGAVMTWSVSPGFAEPPTHKQPVHAELIAEEQTIQPGRPLWVAVRLTMEEGWHTYWMNPGDSGMATQVRWRLPKGWQAGELQWPYPERIVVPGGVNFGYHEEAWLLAELRPPAEGLDSDAFLGAQVDWVACQAVCVAGGTEVSLRLPIRPTLPQPEPRWMTDFAAARTKLPRVNPKWHAQARVVVLGERPYHMMMSVRPPALSLETIVKVRFFPTIPGLLETAEPLVERQATHFIMRFAVSSAAGSAIHGPQLPGVLVVEENASRQTMAYAVQIEASLNVATEE